MKKEVVKSTLSATLVTSILVLGIVLGSRGFEHFDAALIGYTFASVAAVFGISYRYTMWLQRPATSLYWLRGWKLFFTPEHFGKNVLFIFKQLILNIAFTRFIWRRGIIRGGAHWLIMMGCFMAAAITFPLVFGWLYFIATPGKSDYYRIMFFGFPMMDLPVESAMAHFIFHGLVIASLFVIPGVMIAMHRRMQDRDAAAVQTFEEDMLPLIMLFAVSFTGIMLAVSYTWLSGYGYSFLAGLHAITVIITLIWLPFGKFFHIFQRPAQIGVALYKEIGLSEGLAPCSRCNEPFMSEMHLEDLKKIQMALGYQYNMQGTDTNHYQHICPRCRRLMVGLAQGQIWSGVFGPLDSELSISTNGSEGLRI